MRKYLLHVLIISFVFLLAPTAQVATYAGAIEDAREEVRRNPDDAEAHYNLGIAYGESSKWKEEIEAYKQAIKINPDFANAYFGLGAVYVFSNDRASALEQYKILKNLDPELANDLFDIIYRE